MKETKFRKVLKEKIISKALIYLKEKTKSKGSDIENRTLHMADYLLPHSDLLIIEKQEIFEIRNKMTKISANFNGEKELSKCVCGQHENMEHIYECKTLSS